MDKSHIISVRRSAYRWFARQKCTLSPSRTILISFIKFKMQRRNKWLFYRIKSKKKNPFLWGVTVLLMLFTFCSHWNIKLNINQSTLNLCLWSHSANTNRMCSLCVCVERKKDRIVICVCPSCIIIYCFSLLLLLSHDST